MTQYCGSSILCKNLGGSFAHIFKRSRVLLLPILSKVTLLLLGDHMNAPMVMWPHLKYMGQDGCHKTQQTANWVNNPWNIMYLKYFSGVAVAISISKITMKYWGKSLLNHNHSVQMKYQQRQGLSYKYIYSNTNIYMSKQCWTVHSKTLQFSIAGFSVTKSPWAMDKQTLQSNKHNHQKYDVKTQTTLVAVA